MKQIKGIWALLCSLLALVMLCGCNGINLNKDKDGTQEEAAQKNVFEGTCWLYTDGPISWTFTFSANDVVFDYAGPSGSKDQYKAPYTHTDKSVSFTLVVWSETTFVYTGTLDSTGKKLVFKDSGLQKNDMEMTLIEK